MVRTRADADTVQSRKNDVNQREKALASGAQFVSTDYAEPDRRFSDYSVRFPAGQVARSNPISGDPAWADLDLETGKPAPATAKELSRVDLASRLRVRPRLIFSFARPRSEVCRSLRSGGSLAAVSGAELIVTGSVPFGP